MPPHNPLAKIALIDMDDTVAHYFQALHAELNALASPGEPALPYNPHDGPDWLEARINLVHRKTGFWAGLKPIQQGLEIASFLKASGYDLHVLTKGPRHATSAWTEKRNWCHAHLDPDTPVTITEDKGLIFGDVLFDDFPGYVKRWLVRNPCGKSLMFEYEYNKDFEHPRVFKVLPETRLEEIHSFLTPHLV